ncbi:MAG: hypothetical protein EP330_26275 [Deltaproteobacteria bacterium]|nr:MAG: hypothetical protein EP330_26275 [Deltaproteobacteria bacterium]
MSRPQTARVRGAALGVVLGLLFPWAAVAETASPCDTIELLEVTGTPPSDCVYVEGVCPGVYMSNLCGGPLHWEQTVEGTSVGSGVLDAEGLVELVSGESVVELSLETAPENVWWLHLRTSTWTPSPEDTGPPGEVYGGSGAAPARDGTPTDPGGCSHTPGAGWLMVFGLVGLRVRRSTRRCQ